MKFPLPIQTTDARNIRLTQAFGPTSNVLEPEGPAGQPHFHYGVDLVCGDDHQTYGAALRCPFPGAQIVNRFEQPEGSKETPFLQLQYRDTAGTTYDVILAHCIDMAPAGRVAYGDEVAKIGNIGLVAPQPSLRDPYGGAHLHLGLKINGAWTDPLAYFDLTRPFIGTAPTQADQLPATNWLIKELLAIIAGITGQKSNAQ